MGVLRSWLGDMELAHFRAQHLGRIPLARPNAAQPEIPSCDWDVLDRLLMAAPADVLVVARGRLLDLPPPPSTTKLRELFARGAGIAVRGPERYCSDVASLADAFARDLPGEQRVIVF